MSDKCPTGSSKINIGTTRPRIEDLKISSSLSMIERTGKNHNCSSDKIVRSAYPDPPPLDWSTGIVSKRRIKLWESRDTRHLNLAHTVNVPHAVNKSVRPTP